MARQPEQRARALADNTHLQEKGALAIGQLAMADAYEQKLPLSGWLKAVPVAP